MSSLHDTDGFAIYWVLDDAAIECTACDPEEGDPETWPAWTDLDRFTYLDPPDQGDVEWLNSNPALPPISGGSPADDDPDGYDEWSRRLDEWYRRLEELHQACEWQDRLEQIYHVDGDEQAAVAGGGV